MGAVHDREVTPPEPRKHYCSCGRYLGESRALFGYIVVKCPSCGSWRKLDFSRDGVANTGKVA